MCESSFVVTILKSEKRTHVMNVSFFQIAVDDVAGVPGSGVPCSCKGHFSSWATFKMHPIKTEMAIPFKVEV